MKSREYTMSDATNSTEALLAHTGWVRQLARTLVADPHGAEDLAQDTLAVALEHPPGRALPLRGWLTTVARNLVRQNARASERRARREALASRHEALAATSEVAGRLGVFRALVEHVESLAEPFRTTVLLRYFDELPPRRIAELQGVPVKTVNSRLTRGLERLRSALADQHGDGEWRHAVAPLAQAAPAPAWPPFAGVPLTLAVGIAVLTMGGWWWTQRDNRDAPTAPAHQVRQAGASEGASEHDLHDLHNWRIIDERGTTTYDSEPATVRETHRVVPYREQEAPSDDERVSGDDDPSQTGSADTQPNP